MRSTSSMIKASTLAFLLFTSGFSQIGISGYLAAPVGDFASSTGGMAETRFGAALSVSKPIHQGLSVGFEANFVMNTVDRGALADQLLEETGGSSASVSGGTYFNFPLFANLGFRIPLSGSNSISLLGGLGYDFLRMMDMEIELDGAKVTSVFDPGGALAFSVGATVGLGKVFVGAKYMGLGEHKMKAKISGPGGTENTTGEQEMAVVGILAGVHF
jgi:hypothetical protein